MIRKISFVIFISLFQFCSLSGNENAANLGFLAFLSRLTQTTAQTCLTYAKNVTYESSDGSNNSYVCSYKPDSISMECVYSNSIQEDNTSTTVKTDFFNSTEEFIARTKNFAMSTTRYSQLNNDITTNKFFEYDSENRLTNIIQSDQTKVTMIEYDANKRYTKAIVYLSNGICQVPVSTTYDDTNLIFKQTISFSQTSPATNFICYFISISLTDQITEMFFDKNFFLTKKIKTIGSNITTETYTTKETANLCTGNDGTAYSAPIIHKFNSTGGAVGETVSITGINFDTDPGANAIQFANGVKTFASSATNSSLSFIVPGGATSSQLTVTNRYGKATSKNTFYVYKYFLYAASALSNSINGFEINIADGGLITPVNLGVGNQPGNIIINPNGKFGYIINQGILAVNSVSISSSNGSLSNVATANAGTGARGATIDSTGKYLFVANQTGNNISAFLLDSTSGGITSTGGTTASGVTGLYWLVAHQSLPLLYATGSGSSNISVFFLNSSNGNISLTSGSPFSVSANPQGITIHPNGLYLYTANASVANSISKFSINQLNGSLSGETVIAAAPMESIAIDPSGKYLYGCSNANNQIVSFQINQTDGTLSSLGSLASNQCRSVIVDPSGKYVYTTEDVGASGGKINKFIIQSNGSLTNNGFLTLNTNNPRGLAIAKSPQ